MVRKMYEKAGMIPGIHPGAIGVVSQEAEANPARSKTAPGTMMGFLTAQSSVMQEADALKERVKTLEGQSPLRRLDPSTIQSSRWANRHEASFLTADFKELKADIAAAGGNVQAIKVRPITDGAASNQPAKATYELIYGHRRHRACLELGISVLAAIEEASDVSLFEQMERENRGRKNLSAWEQGTMYRKALDDGLYTSLRRLSDSLGIDVSLVSKSVTLARLPETVISAFESPLDIQFRWAAPLAEALQKDPEGTLERARSLVAKNEALAASDVFSQLIGLPTHVLNGSTAATLPISSAGKVAGMLTADKKGRAVIRFKAGAFPESKRKALVKLLEGFLGD